MSATHLPAIRPSSHAAPASPAGLPSIEATPTAALQSLRDVDEELIVDCFTVHRRDFAITLGGLFAGECLLYAVLERAVALQPLATAAALIVATPIAIGLLARAESTARLGLGAQLVARGVAYDVATALVAAERRLGWRFHLKRKHERARLLLAEARRHAEETP